MIKVEIINTKEIRDVTPNIAHGLIEQGVAKLVKNYKSKPVLPASPYESNRLRGRSRSAKGGYSIK